MVFVFNLNYQFDFLTWVYLKNTCLLICSWANNALQLVFSSFQLFLLYFFSKYTFEEGEIFITVFTPKTVSRLFDLFVSVDTCRINVLKFSFFYATTPRCIYYGNLVFRDIKLFTDFCGIVWNFLSFRFVFSLLFFRAFVFVFLF